MLTLILLPRLQIRVLSAVDQLLALVDVAGKEVVDCHYHKSSLVVAAVTSVKRHISVRVMQRNHYNYCLSCFLVAAAAAAACCRFMTVERW